MTPDQAREFFLYADPEDVIDAYAKLNDADPDEVQLRIDWGTGENGEIVGGDIIIGPKFGGTQLSDDDLVSLAISMGGEEWDRPIWEPTWRVA